jgi:hypothetical protein
MSKTNAFYAAILKVHGHGDVDVDRAFRSCFHVRFYLPLPVGAELSSNHRPVDGEIVSGNYLKI